MKCQILLSGKNKKNIINLSSAENAQRVVKVKTHQQLHVVQQIESIYKTGIEKRCIQIFKVSVMCPMSNIS